MLTPAILQPPALAEFSRQVARTLETGTLVELRDMRNRAETLRSHAKKCRLAMDDQNRFAEARLRLERKLGEMLADHLSRGRPKNVTSPDTFRLADFDIDRNLSSRAQKIAAIPLGFFDQFFSQAKAFGWEITTAAFFQRTESDQVNAIARQREEIAARGFNSYPIPHGARRPIAPPTVKLIQGDCLDMLSGIPDRSVGLIACDLPYGSTNCAWDTSIDLARLWQQYKRVLKPNRAVCLTATQPFTTVLGASNIEWLKYDLIWKKSKAADFVHAKNRPLRVHETVLVFSEGGIVPNSRSSRRMSYYPRGLTPTNDQREFIRPASAKSDVCFADRPGHGSFLREHTGYPRSVMEPHDGSVMEFAHDEPRYHPTAKPVALMRWLIEMYTEPGDTVLDSCMGSGSTGVAAIEAGRSFIGIELDDYYFSVATDRLDTAVRGASVGSAS